MRRAPSGEQYEIRRGDLHATLVEVGAGVRVLSAGGRDLLDGYAADAMATGGAGQLLAPWPNRLRDGRYTVGERTLQLPLSEPKTGTAIHGLVRWQPWTLVERRPDAVVLSYDLHPQPGYPFDLRLVVTWSIGDDGLRADHEVTNLGTDTAPFGLGAHPYVAVPGRRADELTIALAAEQMLRTDERGLPAELVAARLPTGPLESSTVDNAFTGLARDDRGRAVVRVTDADGLGAKVWMDEAFGWAQVFTGDTLPEPRRRRAVAVEPMTCPPDAYNTGVDVVRLEPGASWRGAWGIRAVG